MLMPKRPACALAVHTQLQSGRLLDRQVGRPCTSEYPVDIQRAAPKELCMRDATGNQPASVDPFSCLVHHRNTCVSRQLHDPRPGCGDGRIVEHNCRIHALLAQLGRSQLGRIQIQGVCRICGRDSTRLQIASRLARATSVACLLPSGTRSLPYDHRCSPVLVSPPATTTTPQVVSQAHTPPQPIAIALKSSEPDPAPDLSRRPTPGTPPT